MLRTTPFKKSFSGIAAVLAAAALTGCDGGVATTHAPARSVVAELRGKALARPSFVDVDGDGRPELVANSMANAEGDEREAGDRRDEHATERDGDSDERAAADESASQTYALSPSRAREIDLEFSSGLEEPSQEAVVPAPSAWKPAPDSEAMAKPVIDDVWPNKGPSSGGERVVIRGRNLQAAQIVIGLAPAHIIEASEDKVTIVAPAAGAGAAAIVLTNRDGTYAVATGEFQYYN